MADSTMPLISVILTCYNLEDYLLMACESLQAQTYQNWECVIVDDGSTDRSVSIAESYAKRDPRFQCVCQAHSGISAARNAGLSRARGRYIQFLDGDDWVEPSKFKLQIDQLLPFKTITVSYCDYRLVYGKAVSKKHIIRLSPRISLETPLEDLLWRWENERIIPIHCFMFDARLFTAWAIRFDETLCNHVDWLCWVRIFAKRPVLLFLPEPLAVYRVRKKSITRSDKSMHEGFLEAIEKAISLFPAGSPEQQILKRKRRMTSIFYSPLQWLYWRKYASLVKTALFCLGEIARSCLRKLWKWR